MWTRVAQASGLQAGLWPARPRPAGGRPAIRRIAPQGSALLAVLWLTAALSAIAFSVATTVRGELERAGTLADGVRAHYVAAGAIDRAILHMLWGGTFYEPGLPRFVFQFPAGDAVVEIIPESSKLSINNALPEDLLRLMAAAGASPDRAREIAEAILDWRSPPPAGGFSPLDSYYLGLAPSFRARHASFEEIEELLLVKGMTPELFHGGYASAPDGRLVPFGGLKESLSVFGTAGPFEINSASPALLAAIGIPATAVEQIVRMRRETPFRTPDQMELVRSLAGPAAQRLRLGVGSIFTLRATARPRTADGRLSDLRRTVAAVVKLGYGNDGYQILRWQESPAMETGS